MTTLATKYRPQRFADVVGQENEFAVLATLLRKNWMPPALMATGPFGTGKTTAARLFGRAVLCDERQDGEVEPCGACESCYAMDRDNHPDYLEVDAASQGAVSDVRAMKETVSYRTGGRKAVVVYDESHMMSTPAQNALLNILEEGRRGVTFVFCTTEEGRMLATIRSRSLVLNMKLLRVGQIKERLETIGRAEGMTLEGKAASLIGTYVRGHVRDAVVLLEQLAQMTDGKITEDAARQYLRLDRHDDVYKLLTTKDKKAGVEQLEMLLCTFGASDLLEIVGEILVNAYKHSLGMDHFTQVDAAWLKKVREARGDDALLSEAEAILTLKPDYATIQYGIASFSRILLERETQTGAKNGLRPGRPATQTVPPTIRKPGM